MSANKQVAVANAKLKAIQEPILEGELGDPPNFPDMDITECQERTVVWDNTSSPIRDNVMPPPRYTPKERITAIKGHTSTEFPETTVDHMNTQRGVYSNRRIGGLEQSTPAQHAPSYYPPPGLVTPVDCIRVVP